MGLHFIHFADLHLGIENYGHIDPATGLHTRVQDFTANLCAIFDLAIEEEVDLVLFAGDAYKTCDPNPTHQREFASQLRRLQQANIPLVMVVGNHDMPAAFGKATSVDIFAALELNNTYVIRRPQLLRLDTRSGPLQIAGLPWPTRHLLRAHDDYKDLDQETINEQISQICAQQIEEFARQLDPDVPAVLTAHIAAAEATYSGSERTAVVGQDPTLLTSTLAHPAFDYVALGHVHKYQNLNPDGAPPVIYSGSPERITFGEERDEKGFSLVAVEQDGDSRRTLHEFIPTETRPFVTVQAEISAATEDPTEPVLAAIAAAPIKDAVVRVIYTLPATHISSIDLERVHQALAPAFHIAGILPRVAATERLRRTAITEDLGLREALDKYIENNPDLEEHCDVLRRYALDLEKELELFQPEEEES
jgi:exonuclease SbcD